jgi:hypothetical protein
MADSRAPNWFGYSGVDLADLWVALLAVDWDPRWVVLKADSTVFLVIGHWGALSAD